MDYRTVIESRYQLTFAECNILNCCIEEHSKDEFLYRMHTIIENTEDEHLKQIANHLTEKILLLSDTAFFKLCQDVKTNTVLFPPNYYLPM